MKRFIIILALFSYLFPQDGKLAVSILDFTGEDVSEKLLRACYQKLETSLIESNRFTVIAKNQREQILEEMKFQSSGVCDEECAVEIGKLVGAEYLMLGDIIGFADLYQINIKIVNIEKISSIIRDYKFIEVYPEKIDIIEKINMMLIIMEFLILL